jgi:hypothetical protein
MYTTIAKYIILLIVIIIACWDIFAVSINCKDATLSVVLLSLTKQYPIIAFVIGVVVGHLFWPNP